MGLQGPLGGHDRQPLAAGLRIEQFRQHLQLPPGDLAGGIEGFVGRPLAGGIELAALPAHQLQQRRHAARFLQGGHHHQQRCFRHPRQGTGDQGPAGPAGPPEPQPFRPLTAGQHLPGEGHLLQLPHQGGEGHRGSEWNVDPRKSSRSGVAGFWTPPMRAWPLDRGRRWCQRPSPAGSPGPAAPAGSSPTCVSAFRRAAQGRHSSH